MRDAKTERKRRADERDRERAKRTPAEQLAILDERLGEGVGAVRERARLEAQINN